MIGTTTPDRRNPRPAVGHHEQLWPAEWPRTPKAAAVPTGPLRGMPSVSVVVPTYREVDNVDELIGGIRAVAAAHRLDLELIIVDDASDDGTAERVAAWGPDPRIRLIRRAGPRSLSRAVVEGLRAARGRTLVVMDADLSHPPAAIPELVRALRRGGPDFVIGSRFVAGAAIDERWSTLRRLNSLAARVLARPLVPVADSTSGLFALRRESFEAAAPLDPVGYKIGLELMVKCGCRRILEVPIRFRDRARGETKLGWRQQLEYLEHLRRLAAYRWLGWLGRTGRRPAAGGDRRRRRSRPIPGLLTGAGGGEAPSRNLAAAARTGNG